jgi:hypothetical protein
MLTPRSVTLFLLSLSIAFEASAGATLPMPDLIPILKQQSKAYAALASNYALPNFAFAEVRLGSSFKYIAGRRTGPYTFLVQEQLQSKATTKQVLVCTKVEFRTAHGRTLTETHWQNATHVREKLLSISFQEPGTAATCTL